jgi:hypothetical protein
VKEPSAGGTTNVYELSIPCSPCSEGALESGEETRGRRALQASSSENNVSRQKSKHFSRVAHSLANKQRSLQDLGAGGQFEMDFLVVGDEEPSAAVSFGKLAVLFPLISLSVGLSLLIA